MFDKCTVKANDFTVMFLVIKTQYNLLFFNKEKFLNSRSVFVFSEFFMEYTKNVPTVNCSDHEYNSYS